MLLNALKYNEKIIRENAFELKTKETRNKFNPGGADRPSNNWAQQYTVTT